MCWDFNKDDINDKGGSNKSNLNYYHLEVVCFAPNTTRLYYIVFVVCICVKF